MQRRNSVSPPDLITDLSSQPFISRNKESVSHLTLPWRGSLVTASSSLHVISLLLTTETHLWTLSLPDARLELSHESAESKVICSGASHSNITILIVQLTTNQKLRTFPTCIYCYRLSTTHTTNYNNFRSLCQHLSFQCLPEFNRDLLTHFQ
jgi:hypothetical protein